MNVRTLFEDALRQRGLDFSIDPESGRYVVEAANGRNLISLENLQRDVAKDGDITRVPTFLDSVLAPRPTFSVDKLYWSLEPNDYEEASQMRTAVSDRVDRVLVHLSNDGRLITWVTHDVLDTLGLSKAAAETNAFSNLARALSEATIESQTIEGVELGYIATTLPFKASLILAPNLREVAEATLGWPLMAVVPDRDFLYLWAARHTDFVQRVGHVVVREYLKSSYPISTEVYEVTDEGIQATGEFPTNSDRKTEL